MRSRLLSLFVLAALLPFLTGATIVIRGPRVPAAGGSPAWTDSLDFSTTDNYGGLGPSEIYWVAITLPTGTASQLRFKAANYSFTSNAKLALYSNAGSKLQEATVSVTGNGTFSVTITNQSVTSGSYFVAIIVQDNAAWSVADLRASGTLNYNGSAISGFTMPASLPSNDGPVTRTIAAGVYVTP